MSDERMSTAEVLFGSSSGAPVPDPATTSRVVAAVTGAPLAKPAEPAAAPGAQQQEPERASTSSVLYGAPEDSGINLSGVPVHATEDALPEGYDAATELQRLGGDTLAQISPSERGDIGRAMVAAGLGRSAANAVTQAFADALQSRGGVPMGDAELAEKNEACRAELQKRWGSRYDSKMSDARAALRAASEKYLGLPALLEDSGLAVNASFIATLAARGGKKR